ncbi:MAG: flavin reductase family protein [Pseudomonadota bacterium]
MASPPEPERVAVPLERAYRLINPGPLLLISTHDGERANVCTIAWNMPLSRSPALVLLAMDPGHKTHSNILRTGVLGINVPTADQVELVRYFGSCSGHDVDKVAERGLGLYEGGAIAGLPLLRDAAAWLECRRTEATGLADHDLVLAQVVAAWARPGVLDAEGCWNSARFPTLHHAGGSRFMQGTPWTGPANTG